MVSFALSALLALSSSQTSLPYLPEVTSGRKILIISLFQVLVSIYVLTKKYELLA